jgi:hypothetical protein
MPAQARTGFLMFDPAKDPDTVVDASLVEIRGVL